MSGLREVVLELERHASAAGWDVPPRVYALVDAARLHAEEPEIAREAGVPDEPGRLAVLEQPSLPGDKPIEDALAGIEWPEQVTGCALVLERIVLAGDAADDLPSEGQREWVAEHPGREDARLVIGVLRDGSRHSAIRLRGHDSADEVLSGPDLVPQLADALDGTLT